MPISTVKRNGPARWSVDIPGVRFRGEPLQLTGKRPDWYSPIYFAGLAGVVRAILTLAAPADLMMTVAAYGACFVLGPIIGKRLPARSEVLARVCSGGLGLIGVTISNLGPALGGVDHPPSPAAAAVPVVAAGLLIVVNGSGALMCRLFPERPTRRRTARRASA